MSDPSPSAPSESEWFAFIDAQFAQEHREAAKQYAKKLLDGGLPVVFDLKHLELYVGIDHFVLASMVYAPRSFYRRYQMAKRLGGTREITAPMPSLLEVQRWVLKRILQKRPLANSVHGFRAGRSIVSNVQPHLGARCILRMDLKDFFPSIRSHRIRGLFATLGYSSRVAWDLARLCTIDDALPQGAATSPALANIIGRRMDLRLEGLSRRLGLQYTRYADDLTFSGETMSLRLPGIIESIVADEGLCINDAKTRLMRGSSRKIVTGISVGSGTAHLPRLARRQLRAEVFAVMRSGPMEYVRGRNIGDPQYLQRLLGRVAFWLQVEPTNELAQRAHRALSEFYRQARST